MKVRVRKPSKAANRKGGGLRRWIAKLFLFALAVYALIGVALLALRWVNPWTTTVQMQRRIEAFFQGKSYTKRYSPVPLSRITPALQHAVIAAEDGRFYQHWGIDWEELRRIVERDIEKGRVGRGGSTITQQLVKNLFLTTHRSYLRKAIEFAIAPLAELVLPKRRILELYLNVIEWGPGVWGAEAAAQYHYGASAARLTRDQSSRLAAIIPAPSRRRPSQMHQYSAEIQARMAQMGW